MSVWTHRQRVSCWPLVIGLAVSLVTVQLAASQGSEPRARGQERTQSDSPMPRLEFPLLERSNGETYTAKLVSLDEAWNLTVETASRQIILPLSEIASWGSYEEEVQSPLILLRDGSRLAAEVVSFDDYELTVTSRQWEATRLPWDNLRACLLQPPLGTLARDRWLTRLADPAGDLDVLYLSNGDELHCTLLGGSIEGANQEQRAKSGLRVRLADSIVEIERANVIAIRFREFDREVVPTEPVRAICRFRDGTQLACTRCEVQRESVHFLLGAGPVLKTRRGFSAARVWDQLTLVRPPGSDTNYLSDLEPARYEALPSWDRKWEFKRDQSVVAGALRHRGRRFDHGIGMHGTSSLAYVLDGKYSRFRAWVGIDQTAGEQGSVIFRVYHTRDGATWEEAYRSPIVRGSDDLLPIELDITGVYAITISVDRAGDSGVMDRANWIEARID